MAQPVRAVIWSLAAGLAVGVLTVLGQKQLPDTFVGVANSAVVWALFGFVAGAFARSLLGAALVGSAVQVGAVVGYYVTVPILVEGASTAARSVVIWGVVAVIAGPVVGVAGMWWRSDVRLHRLVASGVGGGAFMSEGIRRLTMEPEDVVLGWAMVAIGAVILIARPQSLRDRAVSVAVGAVVTLAVWAAFWLVDAAFRG